uniref:Uncharacterized protein n=1 Tax=Cyprinodon variegatus TaxID=28743 RepID=A0A3Q2D4T7_CYPVA
PSVLRFLLLGLTKNPKRLPIPKRRTHSSGSIRMFSKPKKVLGLLYKSFKSTIILTFLIEKASWMGSKTSSNLESNSSRLFYNLR